MDLSTLSNEELLAAANGSAAPPADLSKHSNEELLAAAGMSAPTPPAAMHPGEFATSPEGQKPAPIKYPGQAGVQGTGSGLAHLVGGLPDLVNAGTNLLIAGADKGSQMLGGPELPFRFGSVSNDIKNVTSQVAESVGIPVRNEADFSPNEKLAYNINDFGAQAAGSLPLLAQRALTRSAEMTAGSGPKALDSLVKPYAGDNIGRTVIGDAAGATGAAVAKTKLDENGYDNPLLQMLAVIAGGMGGAAIPQTAERGARSVASAAGKPFGTNIDKPVSGMVNSSLEDAPVTKAVSDRAAATLRNEAVNPDDALVRMRANQAELQGLTPDAPMPSPAHLSEDPGLAALEGKVRANNPAPAIARDREFNSKVRDTVDRVAPDGSTPQALVDRVQRVADARNNIAQGEIQHAQGRAQGVQMSRVAEAEASVQPYQGHGPEASQRLDQSIVDNGYIPARAEKNRLYNEGVPGDTPVDLSGSADAARRVRGTVEQAMPSQQARQMDPALLNDAENLGPSTYDAARQNRMALSEERNRARAAGDFTRADNIGEVRRPIDAEMNRVNPAAEQNYRENFAPTYRPGPGDEAAKFTKAIDGDGTRSKTPPSQTAGRFLRPGQLEKHDALVRMIEGSADPQQGQAAAREYLMADMAGSGVVDRTTGVIRPDRLRQWQQKWGNLDNVTPGFHREITDMAQRAQRGERLAGGFADELAAATTNARQTQEQIDRGAFGLVLNSDPDKAVHAVMSQPNRSGRALDELIRVTEGDPQARNGLKAAVRDYLVNKATSNASEKLRPGDTRGPVSQAKLASIFKEHEQEMARVFSPEEMNTLRAGHKALELANIERLRVSSGSDTAQKSGLVDQFLGTSLGKGVEAALRLKYGMLKAGGMISTGRRMLSGVTGGPNPDEVVRVIERASVDPELMGLLLGRKMPVGSPAWNSKLNKLMALETGARESED